MFEKTLGRFKKKTVKFDGETLQLGKLQVPIKEIKMVIYEEPTALTAGSFFFSRTGLEIPTEFEDVLKYSIRFNEKDREEMEELLYILGDEELDLELDIVVQIDDAIQASQSINAVICPNCNSTNIQNIGNNKKSFSVGKAVGGAVLTGGLGGLGTLAGFAGQKGKTDKWHCQDCGNLFDK